jgi:negative regulator of flagellin synthesis FlgM
MEETMSYMNGLGSAQLLLSAASTTTSTAATTRSQSTDSITNSASTSAPSLTSSFDDQTSFSAGSLIAQRSANSDSDSDVRTEKVAALQQAIAAGTYSVSASDVADKLLKTLVG